MQPQPLPQRLHRRPIIIRDTALAVIAASAIISHGDPRAHAQQTTVVSPAKRPSRTPQVRPPTQPLAACRTPSHPSRTVNGKYKGLLRRLHLPGDCQYYGTFRDYGHFPATSYGGHANLPAAYWVYHYPYWYLYRQQRGTSPGAPPTPPTPPIGPTPPRQCQTPTRPTATANGKYLGFVLRIHVPGDCQTYGDYRDWGWHPGHSYAGHQNLPAGYWVWHYPYWYLYQQQVGAAPPLGGGQAAQPQCRTPKKLSASANGKYQGLVLRLHVPADCHTYGSYRDWGYWPGHNYAGHQNLPAGYWVYHYPSWYLYQRQRP